MSFSLTELDAVLSNLGLALNLQSMIEGELPSGLGSFSGGVKILAASTTQIALGVTASNGDTFTLLVNGTGFSLTGGLAAGSTITSTSDFLSHAIGTIGSLQLYAGGSFGGGTVSGGTLVGTMTVGTSQDTLTTPDLELIVNGSNFTDTFQGLDSILTGTYVGGPIGFTSAQVVNTNTDNVVMALTLTSTSLVATEGNLTLIETGSFPTSIMPGKTGFSSTVSSLTLTAGSTVIFSASGSAAQTAGGTIEKYFFNPTLQKEVKYDFLDQLESDVIFRHSVNGVGSFTILYDDTNTVLQYLSGSAGFPSGFTAVRPGTFDGSGASDIVYADAENGKIDIATGASVNFSVGGSPTTFASVSTIGTAPYGWWIAGVGDFFDDGITNILFRNTETNQVALWETNGSTLLASQIIGTAPQGWIVAGTGDFSGNGYSDILWYDQDTGQVAIWEMDGTSVVSATVLAQTVPENWKLAGGGDTGDFFGNNEDGILFRDEATGQVAIWQMDGSSVVSETVLSETMSAAWRVAEIGDFFGIGSDGIVWQNVDTNQVEFWEMQGTSIVGITTYAGPSALSNIAGFPGSQEELSYFSGPYDLFPIGTASIVWENPAAGQAAVWQMGAGSPVASGELPLGGAIPAGWQAVGVGVFFAYDGEAVVWQNSSSGQFALWSAAGNFINGISTFGGIPSGWQIAGLGDFFGTDQDGILWRNDTTGQTAIWQMNGNTILGETLIGVVVPSGWLVGGVADFNGDGRADILWFNPTSGQVAVWEMNGTSLLAQNVISSAPSGWTIAGVGDFDGFNKPEILWENQSAGELAVWQTNGTSLTAANIIATGVPFAQGWQVAAIGEYTGTTQDEVLWQNSETGQIAVWQITSGGVESAGVVAGGIPSGWQVVANPVLRA